MNISKFGPKNCRLFCHTDGKKKNKKINKLDFQEGREICKTMIYMIYIIVKLQKPRTDS